MKIRTITVFIDPQSSSLEQVLPDLGRFASAASKAIEKTGFEVQTCRLATTPFPLWARPADQAAFPGLTARLAELASRQGFAYLALGPALPAEPDSYELIPAALAQADNLFFSGAMTTSAYGISTRAVTACANIIAECAKITADGFANLRFTALGNVQPGGPFFPAAYHTTGRPPAFALGMECADEILLAFQQAENLAQARDLLLARLEKKAATISAALQPLTSEYALEFLGFDFSSAPYPQDWCSAGAALEAVGVTRLGLHGSLAASAFLADTLKRGRWPQTGFNGLMLPVLEDNRLASRAAQGSLTIKDLLLYASVCGTGLDTVPLPGDSSPAQLAALLMDVAALSIRLDKPLTARLMPIPGKLAGDPIEFDFEFFASGRVMALQAEPLQDHLARQDMIDILPRMVI